MGRLKRHAPVGGAAVVSVVGLAAVLLVALVVMPGRDELRPFEARVGSLPGARTQSAGLRPGSVRELRVRLGAVARFRIQLDRADTVHVRGLGVRREVRRGRVTKVAFRAVRAGKYPVELEGSAVPIAIIRVARRE